MNNVFDPFDLDSVGSWLSGSGNGVGQTDPFGDLFSSGVSENELVQSIIEYDPFDDVYSAPAVGPTPEAMPEPEELRSSMMVPGAVRPTPLYELPEQEIAARDEFWARVLGRQRTWRDVPIIGVLGSSALALLGGAAQGIVDTIRLVAGDYYDQDRSWLDRLSSWLGQPVVEHQKRNAIAVTRASMDYGMPGVIATKFGQAVVDIGLFLLSLKLSGLGKILGAPGKLTAVVRGGRAVAGTSDLVNLAFRGTTAAQHLDAAAKLGGYMFLTTPGGWREKLRSAVITGAFRATPAFSSQVGKVTSNPAVIFLGRTGDDFKAFALDALANLGIDVVSGKISEALEVGRQEAELHGDKEHAWAWQLANLLPILGADLWFSWSTRSWATYHKMLSERLPPELGTEINRAVTPDEYRSILVGWVKKNAQAFKSAYAKSGGPVDPAVAEVLSNPDRIDTMKTEDVIDVTRRIYAESLRWTAQPEAKPEQPVEREQMPTVAPSLDFGRFYEMHDRFISGASLHDVLELLPEPERAKYADEEAVARYLAGGDESEARGLLGLRAKKKIEFEDVDDKSLSYLSDEDLKDLAETWLPPGVVKGLSRGDLINSLAVALKNRGLRKTAVYLDALSGREVSKKNLNVLTDDFLNIVVKAWSKSSVDADSVARYPRAAKINMLAGLLSNKSLITSNLANRLVKHDRLSDIREEQLSVLPPGRVVAIISQVLGVVPPKGTPETKLRSWLTRWLMIEQGKGGGDSADRIRAEIEASSTQARAKGRKGQPLYIWNTEEDRLAPSPGTAEEKVGVPAPVRPEEPPGVEVAKTPEGVEAARPVEAGTTEPGSLAPEPRGPESSVVVSPIGSDWVMSRRDLPAPSGQLEISITPDIKAAIDSGQVPVRKVKHPGVASSKEYTVIPLVVDISDPKLKITLADPRTGLQNRQAINESLRKQYQSLGVASNLDPARLLDDGHTDSGAPIVVAVRGERGPELVVVSGNTRFDAIRSVYLSGSPRAQDYKNAVRDYAVRTFGADISNMSQPVVLRLLVDTAGENLAEFVRQSNRPRSMGLSDSEKIAEIASVLRSNPNLLFHLSTDVDDLMSPKNVDFVAHLVGAMRDVAHWFVDNYGKVTNQDLIKKGILSYLLGMGAEDIATIDAVMQRPQEYGISTMMRSLLGAAPAIARVSMDKPEFGKYLSDAVRSVVRAVSAGDIDVFSMEQSLFGGTGSRFVVDPRLMIFAKLVGTLKNAKKDLVAILTNFADSYHRAAMQSGRNLFGEEVKPRPLYVYLLMAIKKVRPDIYQELEGKGYIRRADLEEASGNKIDVPGTGIGDVWKASEEEARRAEAAAPEAEASPAARVAAPDKAAEPESSDLGRQPDVIHEGKLSRGFHSHGGVKLETGETYRVGDKIQVMPTVAEIREFRARGGRVEDVPPKTGTVVSYGKIADGSVILTVRLDDTGENVRVVVSKRLGRRHGGAMRRPYVDLREIGVEENIGLTIGEIAEKYGLDPSLVRDAATSLGLSIKRSPGNLSSWIVKRPEMAAEMSSVDRFAGPAVSEVAKSNSELLDKMRVAFSRAVAGGEPVNDVPSDVKDLALELKNKLAENRSGPEVSRIASSLVARTVVDAMFDGNTGRLALPHDKGLQLAFDLVQKTLRAVGSRASDDVINGAIRFWMLHRATLLETAERNVAKKGKSLGPLSELYDGVSDRLGGLALSDGDQTVVRAALESLGYTVSKDTMSVYERTIYESLSVGGESREEASEGKAGRRLIGQVGDEGVAAEEIASEADRGALISGATAEFLRDLLSRGVVLQDASVPAGKELELYEAVKRAFDEVHNGLGESILGRIDDWASGSKKLLRSVENIYKSRDALVDAIVRNAPEGEVERVTEFLDSDDGEAWLTTLEAVLTLLVRAAGGKVDPQLRRRAQAVISGASGGISREDAFREIQSRIVSVGGEFEPGGSEEVLGRAKIGKVEIEWRWGEREPGSAGVIEDTEKGYTVWISPTTGRPTTISHELGHIVYDVLTGSERGLLSRVLGVSLDKVDEALAERLSTADGRRSLASDIRKASTAGQNIIIRAINRIVDFVNMLLGTKIPHIGQADDLVRLADELEDFGVLKRLATVKVGTAEPQPSQVNTAYPIGYHAMTPEWRKVFASEYQRAVRDGSSADEARKVAIQAVHEQMKVAAAAEEVKRLYEEDVVRAGIVHHDGLYKPDVSEGRSGVTTVGRAIVEAIKKTGHDFWTSYTMARVVLGPRVAQRIAEVRQQYGDMASGSVVRYLSELKRNQDLIRKAYGAEGVEQVFLVNGKPIKVKLTADELMGIASLVMSWKKALEDGKKELANSLETAIQRFVLGGSGGGNPERVLEITLDDAERLLGKLTDEQRAVIELFNKVDMEIGADVARVFKKVTGRDLDLREYYSHIVRDLSYANKDALMEALRGAGLSAVDIEDLLGRVARGEAVLPIDPNTMSFIKKLEGANLPVIIRGLVRDKMALIHMYYKYLETAPFRQWLEINFTGNPLVRSRLARTFMGREFLRYYDDFVANMAGVASRMTDATEKLVSELLFRRATTVRLASPWVWAKQVMSAPGCLALFGPEYLPSLFKRDRTFINQVISRSPFLQYRWQKKSYDVLWGVHGVAHEAGLVGKMTAQQKVEEFVANMMSACDRKAIESIIMAARDWVRRNKPNLVGDEFIDEVKKQAEMAVQITQVATDNLDRTLFERNVTSPFQRMVVYMYGARAKVWNLMVLAWHSWKMRHHPDDLKMLAGAILGVALQSLGVAVVDQLRSKYVWWKRRTEAKDEDEEDRLVRGVQSTIIGTLDAAASSIPILGNEVVPSLIAQAYSAIGESQAARYRSAKVGQTGVFSTIARDFQTISGTVATLLSGHARLRAAKTRSERKKIRDEIDRKIRSALPAFLRWGSELTGIPVSQIVGMLPIRDGKKK